MDVDFDGAIEVHLTGDSTGQGHQDLQLTSGQLDWQAEEFFGRFHCHWLAGAMHCLTGWDVVTFDVRTAEGEWKPVHSGVLTPDGDVVDIFGQRSIEHVEDYYSRSHGHAPTRHRRVPNTHVPGDVVTGIDERRGDRFWWARDCTNDALLALYQHFARLALRTSGHADAFARSEPAPFPESAGTPSRAATAPDTSSRPVTSTTAHGGTAMADIEEIRAAIAEAEQRGQTAAQQLAQVREDLQGMTQLLMQTTHGSHDTSVTDAVGQLQTVGDDLDQIPGRIHAATSTATAYAGRL